MRLGVTDYIDCAHLLEGHPKCGRLHGHTYRIEMTVEGETTSGMLLDFAELKQQLREVLARYDHRHWNDFLDYPTVENICERLAGEIAGVVAFPFTLRVYEGHAKWAETDRGRAR
ncbi:MAG TPA: 6-carboxytetrahydropterin synthase [Planctomycetota bacterium]|jgi:6-pyruvoyltetrahydropterin/6-carboxytetrahydropterin synthase|nr:6-carboxytetrahydropterin synthase [Planctomycetota bacterium]